MRGVPAIGTETVVIGSETPLPSLLRDLHGCPERADCFGLLDFAVLRAALDLSGISDNRGHGGRPAADRAGAACLLATAGERGPRQPARQWHRGRHDRPVHAGTLL